MNVEEYQFGDQCMTGGSGKAATAAASPHGGFGGASPSAAGRAPPQGFGGFGGALVRSGLDWSPGVSFPLYRVTLLYFQSICVIHDTTRLLSDRFVDSVDCGLAKPAKGCTVMLLVVN